MYLMKFSWRSFLEMNQEHKQFIGVISEFAHSNQIQQIVCGDKWKLVENISRKHNLFPLFFDVASKYNSYLQTNHYNQSMEEAMFIIALQVKRTDSFLKLYKSFIIGEVYPLVMKGLICRSLYGELCDHRPSGDEDILVPISDFWRAKTILEENGYFPIEEVREDIDLSSVQEITFVNQEENLHIELHLNPMGRENDARSQMSDCFKDVFDDYIEMEIQGVKVRTMSHQNHFTFLILHALRHFLGGGIGLRQMLDILLYQEKYGPEIDIDKLEETLQQFKAVSFWSDLVHIGNKYLGFNLPIRHEACCAEELLEDMMSNGVFGNDTAAKRTAERTVMFVTGDYLRDKKTNKVAMILKTIFPSKEYLLTNSPYLREKPWLLPIAWVERWCRFLKRNSAQDNSLMQESLTISARRTALLKKYDIL